MLFLAGALFGSLAAELWHRSQDTKVVFAEKLKCQSLAAVYVEKNSDDASRTSYLVNVDYSPARSSCIASLKTTEFDLKTSWNSNEVLTPASMRGHAHFETYEVWDIVTNRSLFADICDKTKDCEGKEPAMQDSMDQAFQKALNEAD